MAEAARTTTAAPIPDGAAYALSATLAANQTGTGATDHVDTLGYKNRAVVAVSNGITNSATVQVEGSMDATNWVTISHRVDGATAATVTANAVAASTREFMFLDPVNMPRYVRANVTVANANGVAITFYSERG